jgi:hypothetical protein
MRMNGWDYSTRRRFVRTLASLGWHADAYGATQHIVGRDNWRQHVEIISECWRSARVVAKPPSKSRHVGQLREVQGGSGRGWPEAFARKCHEEADIAQAELDARIQAKAGGSKGTDES